MLGEHKNCIVVVSCGLVLPLEVPEQIAEYFDMTDELVEDFPNKGIYRCDLLVERFGKDIDEECYLSVSNIREIKYLDIERALRNMFWVAHEAISMEDDPENRQGMLDAYEEAQKALGEKL